ncbi:murein L,D-transpeptidase [Emticicia sp. BO119]|uniref:L,D-transpeptidase family protein n=1 Tax=Emticicia sp. BO119 TaxID=2757768 RepID=UPI0015F0354D|nr:L,D-transpeptidase family protein [Emticicia sp. BO119]MBA4853854.1 L,D-transpeptidase family protein [Emticicia sp. BO119]
MLKGKKFAIALCIVLTVVGCLTGCKKNKKKRRSILPDSSIYSSQNFTDILLDSVVVNNFFKSFAAEDTVREEVKEFYARRSYQSAWFSKNGLNNAAQNFHSQLKSYTYDFADSSFQNVELDNLITRAESDEKKFLGNKVEVQRLDLLLTTTFFNYALKAYGGITKNPLDLEWFIPRKKKNYQLLLDSLVSMSGGEKVREPVNLYYIRLKDKLRAYRNIERKGGWPKIISTKKQLVTGDRDSSILVAKQTLFITGDFRLQDTSMTFTDSLKNAVVRFQHRMGLKESGIIDKATLNEMNQPIKYRIRQIMLNMERLRWVPEELEKDHLLINIPEYMLHVFENGKQAWTMNVVVGKTASQTTIFKGNLSQIVLNPYWNIPQSIIRNEILPQLKHGTGYLTRNNMEVLSGGKVINPSTIDWSVYTNHVPYLIRQRPGNRNSLGKIKFLFPNSYNIYLHDTPAKSLFNNSRRAFSHGCIRLSDPKRLAVYLLKNKAEWNAGKINEVLATDKETGIKVDPTIPVYIVYFTSWVDNTGQINFRNDLYGLDAKLSAEIFGE